MGKKDNKTNSNTRKVGERGTVMSIKEELLGKIANKEIVVGVIGLGYVGLPLAVEKAKAGYKTIGFDIQSQKVDTQGTTTSAML